MSEPKQLARKAIRASRMSFAFAVLSIILALVVVFLSTGCSNKDMEEWKRGRPGSKDYISKEYVQVTIIRFNKGEVKEVGRRQLVTMDHTIVEDDSNRRYRVSGQIGEQGEQFKMDVSLAKEVSP